MRSRFAALLAVAPVLLAACGGGGGGGADDSDSASPTEAAANAATDTPAPPAGASSTAFDFQGSMAGTEQVSGGDPDGTGTFKVTIDKATSKVCYELAWQDIDEPNAAHIHIGKPKENGNIMVDLNLPVNGPKSCLPVDSTSIGHMTSGPTAHYPDLHTPAFPDGAVRGQLQQS